MDLKLRGRPNLTHALDGGIPLLFHFQHRSTEVHNQVNEPWQPTPGRRHVCFSLRLVRRGTFALRLVQPATIAREEWAIEQSNVTWKTPCMLIG